MRILSSTCVLAQGGNRAGFFLGDGVGLGKGRQLAALILENWCRGRKRHLWISGQAVKLWPFSCLERDVGHVAPAGVLSLPRGATVGGACLCPAENEARLVVILYVARCVVSVSADTWLGAAAMPA